MKYSILIAVLAFICLAPMRAGEAELPGAEGIPEIVAEVDQRPITRNELIRELVGASGTKAVERLVHRILIEQAAAEQNIRVTNQDIELQYNADVKEVAKDLIHVERDPKKPTPMDEIVRTKYGMDIAEYKNVIVRQRLLARRLMASDLNPTDAELRKFFDMHQDFFQEPTRYRAAHILLSPIDPRDMANFAGRMRNDFGRLWDYEKKRKQLINKERDENIKFAEAPTEEIDEVWRTTKIRAEQLTKELRAYPNRWDDYVRKFSRDPMDKPTLTKQRTPGPTQRQRAGLAPGEVGWFHKDGPVVRDFYEGAKGIKPGEVGGPVRTEFGYHVVKMLEIKFPQVRSFAESRDRVRELYIDNEIQLRSNSWLVQLAARADLTTEKATFWPLQAGAEKKGDALPGFEPDAQEQQERDPVVGRVNGTPIKRSEVWRELLRSEGEDALRRLINREVVLTILKSKGVPYMEWLTANPEHRPLNAPPIQPIRVREEQMQLELNDDRLEYDKLVSLNKDYANLSFGDYIYKRYGQAEIDYRRAVEASLVLREAIRLKIMPRTKEEFERTLKFEFALARQQYSQSPWFEISHILIVPTGGMLRAKMEDKLAASKVADQIYLHLQQKPDLFAQMVEQYSDETADNKANHGKLGGCYSDYIPASLPESLFFFEEIKKQSLEAGMVTTPLRTPRGFHIVRLDRKHPAREADYEEKRKQIERDYINEKSKHYADVWIRALNSRAIVKHFLYKQATLQEEAEAKGIIGKGKDDLPPDNFLPPRK